MNKITLFIGLNDKDSKLQEITTGEARDRFGFVTLTAKKRKA